MRHAMRLTTVVLLVLTMLACSRVAVAQNGGASAPRRDGGAGPRVAGPAAPGEGRPNGQRGAGSGRQAGPVAPERGGLPKQAGPNVRTVSQVPKPPFPPLDAVHQKYLDDILNFWEKSSDKIKRYECKFQRWEYDPVFGPTNKKDPSDPPYKTYSTGLIKYATPDKGLFKVEKIMHYTAPKAQGEAPKYETRKDDYGDHWVCDGQSVFRFDYIKKELVESPLPQDMRGQAIVDGPLPFLFGAKANKIKERYWVRVVTPSDAKGEYWLEAFPKSRADAANYKKVEIIIDEDDFLPKAIQVFLPGYNERTNPARQVFMFSNRQKNNHILDPLGIFNKDFTRPTVPTKEWKKIVEKNTAEEPLPPKGNQAMRPTGKAPPR